ncbi:MAG: AbrB/MazE/SpoVT family DNA-binding domain-containing protein [Candidatus Thermoplasmatota archaeon]|nr:AbrB/MazE/SpoVT family DNA-binding domain-containing protein [Candidatus Thermoplasmatota archaeon]
MKPHTLNVYGTVKVGERGQVVIPAEARKEFGIKTGDLMLVIGTPMKDGIALIRAEAVQEMISKISMGLAVTDVNKERSSKKKNRR